MQAFPWNINVLDRVQRCADDFFVPEGAEMHIGWEVGSEGFKETLVVLSCIESFSSEDFVLFVSPGVFKIFDVEKVFETGRYVFQKSENSAFRMLISKDVENEILFGCESVPVFRNPALDVRLQSPR
jgi:hypothetical protein